MAIVFACVTPHPPIIVPEVGHGRERQTQATIAGLSATLLHYLRGEALAKVPVWRMMAMPLATVERRARRWARALGPLGQVADGRSMVGGGSLPEESLPTRLLAIPQAEGVDIASLARRLRQHDPPVVARIERDTLLLDPRTVEPRDDAVVVRALQAALSR